jgi:solute carrier family 35, member E3
MLTTRIAEKRPSADGLVDNIDPRSSTELQDLDDELPKYEMAVEPAPISLTEKLITCFWIAVNTVTTLGIIFLSKRYACRGVVTSGSSVSNKRQCLQR